MIKKVIFGHLDIEERSQTVCNGPQTASQTVSQMAQTVENFGSLGH
jgi:hypothetical protein